MHECNRAGTSIVPIALWAVVWRSEAGTWRTAWCGCPREFKIWLQTLGSDDIVQHLVLSSRSFTRKYLAAGGDLQGESSKCTSAVVAAYQSRSTPVVPPHSIGRYTSHADREKGMSNSCLESSSA
jgi:hypothetical protein